MIKIVGLGPGAPEALIIFMKAQKALMKCIREFQKI